MSKPHIRFSYYPPRAPGLNGVWKAYRFVRGRSVLEGGMGPLYMHYFLGLTPSEALRGFLHA